MVSQVQRGLSERRDAYEGGSGPGLLMSIERQRRVDRTDLGGEVDFDRRAKGEERALLWRRRKKRRWASARAASGEKG